MLLDAMWMEERKESMGRGRDQFQVGMRVLAVDDNPVCLKVLETLLRHCQYHDQFASQEKKEAYAGCFLCHRTYSSNASPNSRTQCSGSNHEYKTSKMQKDLMLMRMHKV